MAAVCGRCARKLQHLRTPWHRSLRTLCTASSTSSSEEVDDEISGNVQSLFTSTTKRDPMAVLRALASTVQPNPALPSPEFFEDAFLLPKAKFKQAECLLAKKSGVEAAKYVISKCPEIFPLRKPNPMWEIEDVATDIADVQSEEQLKGFIKTRNAKNAVQAYERLKEQGVEVSLETQNELLDLAAQHLGNVSVEEALEPVETGSSFLTIETKEEKADTDDGDSNSDSDSVDEGFDDEARNEDNDYNPVRNQWKKGNYAEQMFESMTTKDGSTYEAMVLGLVKHNSGSEAYELFKEMRATGHQVSVMTYYLMFMGIAKCDDVENKWEKALNLVKLMGEEPIVLPNLKTFNSLLRIAAVSSDGDKSSTQLALGLIREMLAMGIEPSLESFNQVLRAEYLPVWEERRRAKSLPEQNAKAIGDPSVLDMVITHLESFPKLPPMSDPRDTAFFHSAMSAAFVCVDANVAIRIYNLLKKQNNAAFLGKKHSPFYSAFLMTLAGAEFHLPFLFDYYKEIVPEKLRPRDHVYSSLFNLASRTKTPGLVPKLYDDMRMNQVTLTRNVATALFRALSVTEKPEDLKVHLDIMVDVLYWMKLFNLQPSPFVITRAITMYCLNGKLLEAWRMLDMFEKNRYVPSYSALLSLMTLAAEQLDQFKVVRCFEMLSEFGYSFSVHRRRHFYQKANIPRSEA
ncbi:pentatricopeptide repeat domain-containing protein 3, mitochondrial-like isoform X2 [Orbicella faveolata]|uniref:pentatricopeptide repeat domain-containing protein 3, mitochondrial-like isoform X2 n=1 Tax=Orbicella faveolata TaxID=48498 RepID=UPI0009E57ADF|nr:pentatricopeptide repeat domain-containing protein 3, mitochondrial-like isoform X2 [Orbicella faveolata]